MHETGSEHSHNENGHEHHSNAHSAHQTHHNGHASGGAKNGFDDLKVPKMDFNNLDFKGGFNKFMEVIKLNKSVIEDVARDEKMNSIAAVFLLIGSVVTPLAYFIFGVRLFGVTIRPDLGATIMGMLVAVVMAVLGLIVTTVVANRLFKGSGTFEQAFRVFGLASLMNAVMVVAVLIPFLSVVGLVVAVWMLVIWFNLLKLVFKLDSSNAVLTILVSGLILLVFSALLKGLGLSSTSSMDSISTSISFK